MIMTARDLLNASGAVGVFQLIKLMLSVEEKRRPSAQEVLKHTFFIRTPNAIGYEPITIKTNFSPQQSGIIQLAFVKRTCNE